MSQPDRPTDSPADDLPKVNAALAEWTARSAVDSETLIDRLEGLGYELRGKSEDEIAEVLRHPPTAASTPRAEERDGPQGADRQGLI